MVRKIFTPAAFPRLVAISFVLLMIFLRPISWADPSASPDFSKEIEGLLNGVKHALATHASPSVLEGLRDHALSLATQIGKTNPEKATALRLSIAAPLHGISQI